jgi:hypothetical protein
MAEAGEPTQPLEQLVEHINGLPQDTAFSEVMSFMNQSSSYNNILRMLPYDEAAPLMDAVEAVATPEREPEHGRRSGILSAATSSMMSALNGVHTNFEFSDTIRLLERASTNANAVEGTRTKVDALYRVAIGSMAMTEAAKGVDEACNFGWRAYVHIDETARAVAAIEDPDRQRKTYLRLAGLARKNVVQRSMLPEDPEDVMVGQTEGETDPYTEQTLDLYKKAIDVVSDDRDEKRRFKHTSEIFKEMITGAGKVVEEHPELSAQLIDVALPLVQQLLVTDPPAETATWTLDAWDAPTRANQLASLGNDFSERIQTYFSSDDELSLALRRQLLQQTLAIYDSVEEFVVGIPRNGDEASDAKPLLERRLGPILRNVREVAERFLSTEFEITTQLLETAYKVATVQDAANEEVAIELSATNEVLGFIRQFAFNQDNIGTNFAVLSLGHSLARDPKLPEGEFSGLQMLNAVDILYRITDVSGNGAFIDHLDDGLAEVLVEVATDDAEDDFDPAHLERLRKYIERPDLRNKLTAGLRALRRKEEEDQEPKNDTLRLAAIVVDAITAQGRLDNAAIHDGGQEQVV